MRRCRPPTLTRQGTGCTHDFESLEADRSEFPKRKGFHLPKKEMRSMRTTKNVWRERGSLAGARLVKAKFASGYWLDRYCCT